MEGPHEGTGRQRRSRKVKEKFLAHLALSANVTESARVAGVERGVLYRWRETDPDFAKGWTLSLEEATDALEAEARRRALEGCAEPLTYQGKLICDAKGQPVIRRRYSDGLLRMLLRAHRPARFREAPDMQGSGIISIQITQDDAAL